MNQIEFSDFLKIDLRVGTIVKAETFPEARKPAYILHIDFGQLGTRKSSAQITDLYTPSSLIGQQVIAVINFPEKQIGPIKSQCLVLGAVNEYSEVTLLQPERPTKNGHKIA